MKMRDSNKIMPIGGRGVVNMFGAILALDILVYIVCIIYIEMTATGDSVSVKEFID